MKLNTMASRCSLERRNSKNGEKPQDIIVWDKIKSEAAKAACFLFVNEGKLPNHTEQNPSLKPSNLGT